MKVLVVGLDGADYFWVTKLWGSMPTLHRLVQEGSFGELTSTKFPTTPQAWCSMYTGCTPEEHGISSFRKDGIAPIRVRPWWEHIQRLNIGLVSVPLVSAGLSRLGDRGFVIPGFSAPRKWAPSTWAQARYVTETTNHQRGRARWLLGGGDRLKKNIKEAQIGFLKFNRETESRRVDLALQFQRRSGADILFVGLMLIDRIGHAFAHHAPTMEDTYRTSDRLLRRLIAGTDPELVVVFSDHGMEVADSERIPQSVLDNEKNAIRKNPKKLRPRGLHTMKGILCFSGPGIRNCDLGEVHLWDIAPTLLHMLNGEVPNYMTGKVLPVCSEDLSDIDEVRLSETLAALGYV